MEEIFTLGENDVIEYESWELEELNDVIDSIEEDEENRIPLSSDQIPTVFDILDFQEGSGWNNDS